MIQLENVSKTFKKAVRQEGVRGMFRSIFSSKHELIRAVNNISFTVGDGESVGYIGANGAGKSTTIKMMSGIMTPSGGKVLINGIEPYDNRNRNKVLSEIGVVFGQRTQLWWDLPVVETFKLLKQIYNVSNNDYKQRLDMLIGVLELEKFLNSPVRTLSLGQRMRADLCASLIHNPRILFLDEPTIGLDIVVKRNIKNAIKQIQKEYNTTIILTTHDMSDIEDLCNRVIIIDEGSILYDGDLATIRHRFGDIRNITIYTDNNVDGNMLTDVIGQGILSVMASADGGVQVTFDAQQLSTDKLLKCILDNYKVKDIKLSESSIEQVVSKIYENKFF